MKIEYMLNEEFRAGGRETELEFIKLVDNKVKLVNTKTKVAYKFDFGNGYETLTQSELLEKLIKEKTKIDVKSVKVQIDILDTNLYKCDLIATDDIINKNKWIGIDKINEGDKIEVKKTIYYAKVIYAETFKFASSKTMDKYKEAQKIVKKNFDILTNEIVRQLDGYIRAKKMFFFSRLNNKTNYFPFVLAIKNNKNWEVKRWKEYEFWKDLKVKKIYYGKDVQGIGIPRIIFTFNDKKINEGVSILDVLNEFNTVGTFAIKNDNNIENDRKYLRLIKNDNKVDKSDSKITPMNPLEFTIKIPFEVIFERE